VTQGYCSVCLLFVTIFGQKHGSNMMLYALQERAEWGIDFKNIASGYGNLTANG